MSREQWGHGYYKGYEDGERGAKQEKYLCTVDKKQHLVNAYKIIEKHKSTYVLESLYDVVSFIWATGQIFNFDENEEYSDADIVERTIDDMSKENPPILFYNQKSFLKFVQNDLRKIIMEGNAE